MKYLFINYIFPLSVILFFSLTQFWFVLPVDAPHSVLTGFPLPYSAPGWHTSMSLQIFILEFIFDFVIYTGVLFLLFLLINKYYPNFKTIKILSIVLWLVAAVILLFETLIWSNTDNKFYLSRPFDYKIIETTIGSTWSGQPDFYEEN